MSILIVSQHRFIQKQEDQINKMAKLESEPHLNSDWFGVKADGKTDDTKATEAMFDAASKFPAGCTVLITGRIIMGQNPNVRR